MGGVIERVPYYSNKQMWERCESFRSVMTQKSEITSGRGKNTTTIGVPKYRINEESLARVIASCEYYKKLYEEEMNERATTIELRDYQNEIVEQGIEILEEHGFLYLAMEVRTGKTLTSLSICDELGVRNVLFVTKKKAVMSIESDYTMLNPQFNICVINYESLHIVMDNEKWDVVILDEAHGMGAFPKPSGRALMVRNILRKYNPKVILLSGTPTPESYSQMYHQVYGIANNPFSEFVNFYRFCDKYVNVKQRKINGMFINDYSHGKDEILEAMLPYTISYTQKDAGFNSVINEQVLFVEMSELTYRLTSKLKKDLVIEGKEDTILADTPVKLMMKLHQLYSGTIKFESGNSKVLDMSKANFIKDHFKGKKIGIFYKFKEELNALKEVFGDSLTTDVSVFKDTNKNIALQIVSGREGISLKEADYLVYYNIDFSATSYWQSRDRLTTKERMTNDVYWIFSKGGIEREIYKSVVKKKDYTVSHFKKFLE